jgi:PAS domain S-box-containing protein
VARVLAESDNLAAATPSLLHAIGEKLEWDWGALWTAEGEGRLRCDHIWHAPNVETAAFDAICRELAIAPGQGRVGQVWQSASPIWIADATKDQGFLRASLAVKAGLHGALAFPVLLGKHAFGVVEFFSRAARERDEEQLATLSAIGSQIGQFITRKQAERALQERENRFRALIENSHDVVLLVDARGIVRYASPSIARMLGYSPEDVVGRDVFDLVHPDQLEDYKARFAEIVARPRNAARRERLLRHKDGTWRWTEGIGHNLLHEPGVRAVVYNVRDITERKQAEDALRESEQRFRDYAETASDWFWETGPDHRFTRFHGTHLERRRHWTPIGKARWEIATDRDQESEKWREHRADLEARRPFRDFTYDAARADESTFHVAVSGKPVFGQDGAFLGYRGTGADITAAFRAEQAERALAAARAELAHMARVTTLGELSASIAHEINQPLSAVVTDAGASLRWLAGHTPNLDEARQALARIVQNGNRASEVIGRIRALAKKSPIQAEQLDVNETILGVIALMRSELHRNHVLLCTELADDLPIVVADRIQLQQVILNLIMNAIEAMAEGRPRQLVVASGKDRSEHVLVAVRDSGPGLDPEGVHRLFEAFYTTKPAGMGMGLPICRSIIEAHGGQLWASANTPRGAVFQFALPVEKDGSEGTIGA